MFKTSSYIRIKVFAFIYFVYVKIRRFFRFNFFFFFIKSIISDKFFLTISDIIQLPLEQQKNSSFFLANFPRILSLIFPSFILSSLDLSGVFKIEDNGSTLSVFNSFNCSINLNIDVKSLANESDFLDL